MKKLVPALLSALMILAPALSAGQAAAQDRHHQRPSTIEQKVFKKQVQKKVVTKRYVRGHKLSRDEQRRYREVRNYRAHRLNAPPRGYHWVQADRDFILVGIASGIIASVIAGR